MLSDNTKAILLLTAPLIVSRGSKSADRLTPGEYQKLALHLRETKAQPADLLGSGAADCLEACNGAIDKARVQRLLDRGFLLSQAVERWQSMSIWVISRADPEYPSRLKARLREDSPALLYGCGDQAIFNTKSLAVVGSRDVDDQLLDYTRGIGRLAAEGSRTLVSGGARGVDQAAMQGALEAGGTVIGVLASNLKQAVMEHEHLDFLQRDQMVLVSPYDPSAGFSVGHAMQRNKVIYAFADAALVVNSDVGKGGTWTGAEEQLDKLRLVPVYVRSTGEPSKGLRALESKGALPWPNPEDGDSLKLLLSTSAPVKAAVVQNDMPFAPRQSTDAVKQS